MFDYTSRFPIYLLLDTSGSMFGEPIEAVRQGLKLLLEDLCSDPTVADIAYLSIITFDSSAKQLFPLTAVDFVVEPMITADGSTALDDAFLKLEHAFNTELRKKGTETQKADYKPIVFLFTDGMPDDDVDVSWKICAKRLKDSRSWYDLVICGAGPAVNDEFLHYCRREITESVLKLESLQPELLKKFFKLVSQSVKMGSKSVQQNKPNDVISIISQTVLPTGITAVP